MYMDSSIQHWGEGKTPIAAFEGPGREAISCSVKVAVCGGGGKGGVEREGGGEGGGGWLLK